MPQRRRAIMHDPHVGSAAVVALVLVMIGKFAGLAAALDHGNLLPLLLAPVLGRGAVLALMCALPYSQPRRHGRGDHGAAAAPDRLAGRGAWSPGCR